MATTSIPVNHPLPLQPFKRPPSSKAAVTASGTCVRNVIKTKDARGFLQKPDMPSEQRSQPAEQILHGAAQTNWKHAPMGLQRMEAIVKYSLSLTVCAAFGCCRMFRRLSKKIDFLSIKP
jgi:hypothetical protein